ncbi:DUF5906 domain-containing protein [Methylobacterium gnaphalii]|uniref:Uncharacterized protein n=1 Tax=Methylobacterium gnaphalii TaxID=1010610 RepID=A0A512JPZ4_9HYPH|nr:DUF5906 domain-containing protein [Methylobacterium gnaphalii]GEP12011.1 hypothetical protein MGN01_38560 [Methylobacterium gnaphalii]GJD71592.1 hypothetical protein MMMDOFMJ_4555 [Methylobacterium gnaphalii]GLS51223.1 hypothetical protein GCM10007885_40780 [Methylobacterium gnaphalii]
MPKGIEHKRLRQETLDRARQLLQHMYPDGVIFGDEFCIGSIDGKKGQSLKVNLKTGVWADFNVPRHKGGDLISLRAARDNVSYAEAARRIIAEISGDSDPPPQGSLSARRADIEATVPVPAGAPSAHLPLGLPHPRHDKPGYVLTAKWAYRDGSGQLINYVARFENADQTSPKGKIAKEVLPHSFFAIAGWRWKGLGGRKKPLYGLDRLTQRPDAPVLLVEGEKTADAATDLFPDIIAVTWPGGVGQVSKADFTPLRGRSVTYCPDADAAGLRSVEEVARILMEAGVAEFKVVSLPSDLPRGWDMADDPPPGLDLRELLRNAAATAAIQRALLRDLGFEELLERLVYNVETDQFVDLRSGYRLRSAQLNNMFRHTGSKGMALRLLEDIRLRKVQRFAYIPGNEDRIVRVDDDLLVLNLWRPSNAVPQAGDAAPYERHLRYLCPTDEEFEHLANMLAFMAQHPGSKLKSAIVLIGPPGTGKSFVGHVMRRILGAHNTSNVESTDIKSDYNGYMEAKQLVIVEEVMALGRLEIMNRLKPLITQPTVRVNEKYLVAYEIENRANFIFLSNHEDALKLEDGDRRYFIVISDRAPEAPDYYDRLWAWEAQHLGVILDWLLSRDLTGFKPDARPPATEGRRRMIDAGRSDAEVLVADLVADCAAPFQHDLVELAEVRRVISDILSDGRGTTITRPALTRAMRAIGAVDLGQKKGTVSGVEVRKSLWAVRNIDRYRSMSPQALIEQYIRSLRDLDGKSKPGDAEILL